ncbi:hypothetical protein [Priestia megaterium]|uniref:Uncharacterized protein n=1 Tax=Priestia megaterium TaxID=1404 RepID=A0A6M6DPW7_PRIMG|nr:hypothetical protein [Priestia megaterium]QJX76983.1 hypothetical protein FDZ14_12500 [Priestia megaterium]
MKKEVRRIESIIDQDFEQLDFWNINRDAALILSCQLFEEWVFQLDELIMASKNNEKIASLKNSILDLMQGLEWLIKMAFRKNKVDGFTLESKLPLMEYTQEAFIKALTHSKAEQIFIPYGQGFYNAKVNNSEEGEEEIQFQYPSHDLAVLEGINSVLLDEHNNYKVKKYEKADKTIAKLFGNAPEAVYQGRGFAKVEFDFDFPDEYRIGPYTIGDIKNVWRRVIREAWWADRSNRELKIKGEDSLPEIVELKIESWSLGDVSKEITIKLIDDLTYSGKKKGKQKFSTPITEPIIQLSDGRKAISPRFILYNQPGRNILSTLNRIYEDEANADSDMKELIFIEELSDITKDYKNLIVCHDVPVEDTNIDYGIFDVKSKTLVLFEMKWFVEPVTSVEIKSKDEEISKGLHTQLPKYKKAVENDVSKFTLKAFKKELEIEKVNYFVLTRVTIGSGFIKPSLFKTINIRMVKKALLDAKGDLNNASEKLKKGDYYPKLNKDFSLEIDNGKMGGVTVKADSIKKLNNSFNLSVPADEEVQLFGIEMDPDKVPYNNLKPIGPSQYIFSKDSPTKNDSKLNRAERRNQERQLGKEKAISKKGTKKRKKKKTKKKSN